MVYPVFLIERFVFILVAYVFRKKFFLLRMVFLVYLKIGVLSYYLDQKPFDISRGVVRLKIFAEYIHLLIFALTLCFTSLVLDP